MTFLSDTHTHKSWGLSFTGTLRDQCCRQEIIHATDESDVRKQSHYLPTPPKTGISWQTYQFTRSLDTISQIFVETFPPCNEDGATRKDGTRV